MKKVMCFVIVLMLITGGLFAGAAKDYPSRNIEVLVGYSAGGTTDTMARALVQYAGPLLPSGINFVVSNVVGDAGLVAFNRFYNTKPDGYTLFCANLDMAINYANGRTKHTADDWIPVTPTFYDPYGLIVKGGNPNFKNFKEFIEYAKANPGKVAHGHTGIGAGPQILGFWLEKHFKLDLRHVPYNSTADAAVAILAGDIDAHFCQPTPAVSHIRAGTIRLEVMMADKRHSLWPDIPTSKEYYPDMVNSIIAWGFLAARKDTPAEIIKYLEDLFEKARAKPEYAQTLKSLNMEMSPVKTRDMNKYVREQYVFFSDLLKQM